MLPYLTELSILMKAIEIIAIGICGMVFYDFIMGKNAH